MDGPIPAETATAIRRLQTAREQADYEAADVSVDDARAAIAAVEEFVNAVTEALAAP